MRQVVKLPSELEKRLLALLRDRVLPLAQQSLRMWAAGDTRCWQPLYTLECNMLWVMQKSAHEHTWVHFDTGAAVRMRLPMLIKAGQERRAWLMQARRTSWQQ